MQHLDDDVLSNFEVAVTRPAWSFSSTERCCSAPSLRLEHGGAPETSCLPVSSLGVRHGSDSRYAADSAGLGRRARRDAAYHLEEGGDPRTLLRAPCLALKLEGIRKTTSDGIAFWTDTGWLQLDLYRGFFLPSRCLRSPLRPDAGIFRFRSCPHYRSKIKIAPHSDAVGHGAGSASRRTENRLTSGPIIFWPCSFYAA